MLLLYVPMVLGFLGVNPCECKSKLTAHSFLTPGLACRDDNLDKWYIRRRPAKLFRAFSRHRFFT